MLSDDDHPGLFTFMMGVIVVVMAAVGLSLFADTKSGVQQRPSPLARELQDSAVQLQTLTERHAASSHRLTEAEKNAQADLATLTGLRSESAALTERLATLTAHGKRLRQAIPDLDEEFRRYRVKYRQKTWEQAVGHPLGTLKARGGREYRQAVIKRVTQVGLVISHAGGIARIQAPDLAPAIQERFQWNDEERREFLLAEEALQRAMNAPARPAPVPAPPAKATVPPPSPAGAPEPPEVAQLKRLRFGEMLARLKVERINTQLSDARAAIAIGQNAVPGSLETWRSRIVRLEVERTIATAEHLAARATLAAAAPLGSALPPAPAAPPQ